VHDDYRSQAHGVSRTVFSVLAIGIVHHGQKPGRAPGADQVRTANVTEVAGPVL
jgi:hypothetical protein